MRRYGAIPTVFTPSRALEWHCAVTDLMLAVILAMPGSVFDTSMVFDRFELVMSEERWALVIGTVAFTRIIALAINGHWRRTPLLRSLTAAIGAYLHCYLVALFWIPSLHMFSLGAGFAVVLAASDIRSAWRAGRDVEIARRIWKMLDAAPPAPMPERFVR